MPRFDITLAGETNLDIILYGLPEELPLEQEFLADDLMVTLGGSTSITAHNLSALGSKVGLITRVGDDALGQVALDRLRAAGVDLKVTHSTKFRTGLSVLLQHAARRRILTYAGSMGEMSFEDLDLDYLASARHFHLCSFFSATRMGRTHSGSAATSQVGWPDHLHGYQRRPGRSLAGRHSRRPAVRGCLPPE